VMKNTLRKLAVMGLTGLMASAAWADVKVRTKTTTAGHAGESTVYIKGARQRSEMATGPGMSLTHLMQCDQKRTVQINNSCKVYMVAPTEEENVKEEAAAQPAAKPATKPAKSQRGGVITYVSTTTDTTERKTQFGYVARHLKSSMKTESSPDACTKVDFRMEADGWYANLSVGLTCSASPGAGMGGGPGAPPDCQDRVRFRRTGPNPGFALQETRTIYTGAQSFTTTTETLELSKAPLDAALFEIPAGYREVTSMQELMCMGDMQSMMAKAMKGEVANTKAAAAAGASKSAGKLRIGVVGFVNQTQGSLAMETPRQRLVEEIIAREVDAVHLDQTTPEEIVAEARQKECDFILYTDVAKLKQGGGKLGGMFGKVTGGAGGMGKYEVAVNFRLFATGDEGARLASTATTKGEGEAGEVLASVMPEEAKQAVAEALRKK
ncbi:MAG: hypothetical protein ACRESV_05765, partial [Nevskiales bacterium]